MFFVRTTNTRTIYLFRPTYVSFVIFCFVRSASFSKDQLLVVFVILWVPKRPMGSFLHRRFLRCRWVPTLDCEISPSLVADGEAGETPRQRRLQLQQQHQPRQHKQRHGQLNSPKQGRTRPSQVVFLFVVGWPNLHVSARSVSYTHLTLPTNREV